MYLYINTEGGQVVPTMAIMDTMNHAKSKLERWHLEARERWVVCCSRTARKVCCSVAKHVRDLASPVQRVRGTLRTSKTKARVVGNSRENQQFVAKNCNQDIELVRKTINRDKHFT